MSSAAQPASADEVSDELLMSLYAGGDVSAFERLYQRHEMRVWRYLRRNVGDPALADDLSQDVWFAVARQAQRYQPTAKFGTWLFTLAHHRMVDSYRAKPRGQLSLDEELGDEENDGTLQDRMQADPQAGPLAQLESREQAQALLAAIEQLPAEQREAFLLQAEGGMEVKDIAKTTGVSFETAKSRLRYARGKLKQLLQDYA